MPELAPSFILQSRNVVTPDGIRSAAIVVRGGMIESIVPPERVPTTTEFIDVGDLTVMPGLVDLHAEVHDAGEGLGEDFLHLTRAAAAGGVTTICVLPWSGADSWTESDLSARMAATGGKLHVDVAFHGGLTPGNFLDLEPMIEAGIAGVACSLVGLGKAGLDPVGEDHMRAAMHLLAGHRVPLLVHAEAPCSGGLRGGTPPPLADHSGWLASRPEAMESDAVRLLAALCRETGCPVHVMGLSASDSLGLIRFAREEGLPITAGTCPHYLHFAHEQIDANNTGFKAAPPIRPAARRERLWGAMWAGVLDCVSSGHSCPPPESKHAADYARAAVGVSGLQYMLFAVSLQAANRGFTLYQVVDWLADRPARIAGFDGRKGRIAPGYAADLVVWDPEGITIVAPESCLHKVRETPYDGSELKGKVYRTYLGGRLVYERGSIVGKPHGRIVAREAVAASSAFIRRPVMYSRGIVA